MAETAAEFFDKHGYTKGNYEGQLVAKGWNLEDVKAKVGGWGNNMNPGEYAKISGQLGASPMEQKRDTIVGNAQQNMDTALANMKNIGSQEYQFDPNKFLPGIQQQANAIYDPQQQQLEAIRLLQQASYQDTASQTEKQFADTLKSEIESINNRGAYFAGGAIEREQDINDAKLSALNQLGLQATAADFSNLAQQGLLAAEEAQFIQDRLYNAESGAYARWSDQRAFSYEAATQEYRAYSNERDFAQGVFEGDRSFNQGVFESDRAYNLSNTQMSIQREQFQKTYDITKEQFEMAKEEWSFNMDVKKYNHAQNMEAFKRKYDNKNPFPGWGDFADNWKDSNTNVLGGPPEFNISPKPAGSSYGYQGSTNEDSKYGYQGNTKDGGILNIKYAW